MGVAAKCDFGSVPHLALKGISSFSSKDMMCGQYYFRLSPRSKFRVSS